jgi:chromate transporter
MSLLLFGFFDTLAAMPTFREALAFWFKLGCISFGGPAGQIAIMQQELVERKKWIDSERFTHALSYCMLLPGPEAQQLATYCGWLLHGTRGAVGAGLLFILPAFFLLCGLSAISLAFGQVAIIGSILQGLKAVVVALVLQAILKLGQKALKTWKHQVLAGVAFAALFCGHAQFPLILLAGGLIGCVLPSLPGKPDSTGLQTPRATPVWKFIAAGALLWLLPFGWLQVSSAPEVFSQLSLFSTKLALVTFGGAYAVLPYLMQQTTEVYHWLTPGQMFDGLALGETTPGPLIIIVTYVGFIGGSVHGWSGGMLGAFLATYYTFLPSFLFILIGAPYVEKLRQVLWLQKALSGITAVIVGVMGTLAMTLSLHLFWQQDAMQWSLVFLSVTSFVLLRRGTNVLWILAGVGVLAGVLRL